MHIPAHFAAGDIDEVASFVDRAASADLVTFDGSGLTSTLLPVIWDRTPGPDGTGGYGRLLGHIARSNPQWSTARSDVPALAIVHGPQAYISPSWYQSTAEHGRTVPTWNSRTVHLSGPVRFHRDDDWLRAVVTRLTERHESGRRRRWWVSDAPEQFIVGQLRAIVGVEMQVTSVEAKDKLSQNRTAQDRVNVIAALRAEPDAGSHQIADLMAARQAAGETT